MGPLAEAVSLANPFRGERYADAVDAIYAAATAPGLWPQTLEKVADVFDDVGANLFYIRDDGSFGIIVTPSLQAVVEDYREWWKLDIRTQRALEYGYGAGVEAITDRHVASDQEIAEHPFYKDFLRPYGIGWFAGVPITPDPRIVLALTVQRSMALKPAFSDDELAVHTRLGRHAEHALRLSARLLTAEMTNLAFGDALAHLDVGVYLLDAAGKVVSSNPVADRLIGGALVVSDERLVARFEPERAALQAAIESIILNDTLEPGPIPRPVVLHGIADDVYAVAYVLPVRTARDHPFERALFGVQAIVVVRRAKRNEPLDPGLARDLLNVTTGEARVAALVGSGLAPREAAERLGITEETARTTLKRVFAKVGVSRQSELAALLSRLTLG
jgi:DNA-binding CsgD family transcriptional regulator